ncbi:MAG: biliverdin-producing heme oxygenase [Rhodoferax sp.]|nr:biliverdin-producing heme oxygenase [Rhodoferax sp.]
METGLLQPQLTLMEELKAASFTAHSQLHRAPFFVALAARELPLESYVGQLRALALIHVVLEQALTDSTDHKVAQVWRTDMQKLALIAQDLQYFEQRNVPDLKESVAAAQLVAQRLRLQFIEQPLTLLACLYVLEGSMLGAVVLRPMYARALQLEDGKGLGYLGGNGANTPHRWDTFKQAMNALVLDEAQRQQLANAVVFFFRQLETIFLALYPFAPESKVFLVTSINPEAGYHAIPADAREVQAAVRAGDLCWQRFPYFERRYGERGGRFARSDAAWQATLHQFPVTHILQQVRWLGHVLAGRGMPTYLLEIQLKILVTELIAAVPERQSSYEKLLIGAIDLHASRCRYLTDAQLQSLADGFDQAVGEQWRTYLPDIGVLIGYAITDDLNGSVNAVLSLRRWLTDASRFPNEWISAVYQALAQGIQMAFPQADAQRELVEASHRCIEESVYQTYMAALLAGKRDLCADMVQSLMNKDTSVQDLYTGLLQRSMYELGERWEHMQMTVASEHVATAITEQMLGLIRSRISKEPKRNKSIFIACIADEFHQLGARMIADLCEFRGWDSHFHGVNASIPDLLHIIAIRQPSLLGFSLSLPANLASLIRTLDAISSHYPDLLILVGGQAFRWIGREAIQAYPNTNCIASLDELAQKLADYEVAL